MRTRLRFQNGNVLDVEEGTSLLDVVQLVKNDPANPVSGSIVGAVVNNRMTPMQQSAGPGASVKFLDLNTSDGIRIYQRSAIFILIKALHDLEPTAKLKVVHSVANGIYAHIHGVLKLDSIFVDRVEARMRELVALNLPFIRKEVPFSEAIQHFVRSGQDDKVRLLSCRTSGTVHLCELDGLITYFFGYLAPSTGNIPRFNLKPHEGGVLLHLPSTAHPDKLIPPKKSRKILELLQEIVRWRKILEVEDIGMLNELIREKRHVDFIHMAEALHEKKIAHVADTIAQRDGVKVILLAGPSASGKTTFSKRLTYQLRINGFKPNLISMDDYFIDRDQTPRTASGELDYESPHALNIELFKQNLFDIIAGKTVRLPHYDFKTGTSSPDGKLVAPAPGAILVIEGIHGLNPLFSEGLPKDAIYKIYVSALTEVPLDSHNRVPTTDTRLLRRILRDHQFRNYSANDTLLRWPLVRKGEGEHIFPYQEEANTLFNTALIYELAVLKTGVEPLLKSVSEDSPAFTEALRLSKFLSFLLPIPFEAIPQHSILREFIGGGYFE